MNLAKNFKLKELTDSAWASAHKVPNVPSAEEIANLTATATMLQKIRDFLSAHRGADTPMYDLSGFRSIPVNRGIGSADSSHHVKGYACDFKAKGLTPYEVCNLLLPHLDEFGIGQIINELTWVHVSTKTVERAVNRIITIDSKGTRVGILPVR